jgi:hypothetical protein
MTNYSYFRQSGHGEREPREHHIHDHGRLSEAEPLRPSNRAHADYGPLHRKSGNWEVNAVNPTRSRVHGEGNVKNHTLTRLDSFIEGAAGKRLTYKELTQ